MVQLGVKQQVKMDYIEEAKLFRGEVMSYDSPQLNMEGWEILILIGHPMGLQKQVFMDVIQGMPNLVRLLQQQYQVCLTLRMLMFGADNIFVSIKIHKRKRNKCKNA